LEHEESIKDQIPILLNMKQYRIALNIAVSNGEIDIVYGILSHMRTKCTDPREIVHYCGKVEGCIPYLISYARERVIANDSNELIDAIRNYLAGANDPAIKKSLLAEGAKEVDEYMSLAHALSYEEATHIKEVLSALINETPKSSYTRIKPAANFYLGFVSYILGDIKNKDVKTNKDIMSIEGPYEFIMRLAEMSSEKEIMSIIDGMAKKLKIEKRYIQMLKLRGFAKSGNWNAFQDLIKKEKPKIPPDFYAGLCIEFKNNELAATYIMMLKGVEEKIDMLIDIE